MFHALPRKVVCRQNKIPNSKIPLKNNTVITNVQQCSIQ